MNARASRWFHKYHRRSTSLHRAACCKIPSRRLMVEPVEPRLLLSATFQSGMEWQLDCNGTSYLSCVLDGRGYGFDVTYGDLVSKGSPYGDLSGSDTTSDSGSSTSDHSQSGSETIAGHVVDQLISNKPAFARLHDAKLPLAQVHGSMIDVAMVAESRDFAIQGPHSYQSSLTPEVAESGQPNKDNPENVLPRMTVDGARGRGQLFELSMKTDWKLELSWPETPIALPEGPAKVIHQKWSSGESSAPSPTGAAIRPVDAVPQASLPADSHLAELMAAGDRSQETPSRDDAGAVAADEFQTRPCKPVDDDEHGLPTPSNKQAKADQAEHEAVFAALADDARHAWLSPVYLDNKRHVELAAVLVAAVAASRMARLQEQQITPSQTYLIPPRRRSPLS